VIFKEAFEVALIEVRLVGVKHTCNSPSKSSFESPGGNNTQNKYRTFILPLQSTSKVLKKDGDET
jgi:hypothetical protein